MSVSVKDHEVEKRLERLERRLAATVALVSQSEARLDLLEGTRPQRGPAVTRAVREPATRPVHAPPAPPPATAPPTTTAPTAPRRATEPAEPTSLGDFVGGRALAWLGGIATLLGIVLLLGLAISHDWIGPAVRVALAGLGSAGLMAGGMWLHRRGGRTEAAVAMVGAATAGAFATLVVAGDVYDLIPPAVAVAVSIAVGALATALAIRWAGRLIAVLGLIGALLSPELVGAPHDGTTVALLAVAAACAMWVVQWRRWPWLAFATVLVCAPQWATWMAGGHAPAAEVAVLVVFGSLGLIGAVFSQLRAGTEGRALAAAMSLALLNATLIAVAGRLAFGATGGAVWLAGMAAVHAGVALWRWPRLAIHPMMRRLLIAIAVVIADVALALTLHGLVLTAAWGATAVGFAWLARRTHHGEEAWLAVGLGAHVGLVLVRSLIELPPAQLSAGPQLVPLATVAILAAACVGSARVSPARPPWRMTLDALGLLAVGYMTAASVDGAALVGAWAFEAVALAEIARRGKDPVARYGGLGFLASAAIYALAVLAPPTGLVSGVPSMGAAALAVAAVVAAAVRIGLLSNRGSRERLTWFAAVGGALLYLVSIAVISAFQPAGGTDSALVLDLSVRQQGQVLLSALWGVVGIAGLITGLRRNLGSMRTAALGLLLVTVAKVFLYDLSTLTSIYRVVSFFVLGGLLLAGAFAYQRLRPPPLPDLRTVHPSQR